MAMPNRLVFVRHGESEPNLVHHEERNGVIHEAHEAVYDRPDWQQRLAALGLEQAGYAKSFVEADIMPVADFDRRYVSTFLRARETAYVIGGDDVEWHVDDRVKERDWGEYGATPYGQREEKFPFASKAQEDNFWFGRHDGGEGLADGVQGRIRDMIGTWHRDMSGKNVLVVAHGELMTAARYVIERMLPEEIEVISKDKDQKMKNCTILDYSRYHPEYPKDISNHIAWMRMVYPYAVEESPFGGEWQKINEKRLVRGSDLLASLAIAPTLTR